MPRLLHVGVISIFTGMLLSTLLAWLVDSAEKTFYSVDEIRSKLGVPVVGRVPVIVGSRSEMATAHPEVDPILCTLHQNRSVFAEAFRGVRTSLYFSGAAQEKVIQITSPSPGDGKSTMAANLAVTMAQSGKRVLLIDADFRRPTLHTLLGLPKGARYGLASLIAGKCDLGEAAMPTSIENLYFIPALEQPKNPSEILSTARFEEVLQEVREQFDFVILDTPPLLPVTDPCVVAAHVDGVLMVIRIRRGVQEAAQRAIELLSAVHAKVLGVVINGVDARWGMAHQTRYAYGEDLTEVIDMDLGLAQRNGESCTKGHVAFRERTTPMAKFVAAQARLGDSEEPTLS